MGLSNAKLLPYAGLPQWQYQKIQTAIQHYHELGGVLDFALFAYQNAKYASEKQRYEIHRFIAKKTLYFCVTQRNIALQKRLKECGFPSDEIDGYHVFPDPPMLSGIKLTARNFWGNYLKKDENKRFFLAGFGANHIYDAESFPYAFLKPPYGFQLKNEKATQYCMDFCHLLWDDLENLAIYAWNTDCSNYFDDGREWWGTFFWTVYCPQRCIYIGIMGSATD